MQHGNLYLSSFPTKSGRTSAVFICGEKTRRDIITRENVKEEERKKRIKMKEEEKNTDKIDSKV
jgi:hypothetical protein